MTITGSREPGYWCRRSASFGRQATGVGEMAVSFFMTVIGDRQLVSTAESIMDSGISDTAMKADVGITDAFLQPLREQREHYRNSQCLQHNGGLQQ